MNQNNSRRNFIKNASLSGLATLGLPALATTAIAGKGTGESFRKKIALKEGDVILFQGDSITDARRKRDDAEANSPAALGTGYAFLAAAELLGECADKNLKIYNKGISGNKVYQLAERWEADALSIKPDVLSILIGVNDFWHTLTSNYKGTVDVYKTDLRKLLQQTKAQLPAVKLIIGEPFALPGIKSVDEKWYPAFNNYRTAAKEIADEFDAVFIPYQTIFDKATKKAPPVYWTYDGVHPSLAGAHLMAEAWLDVIKG